MAQSWLGSIAEAKANIVIGFALNYGVNLAILPVLWDPASPKLSAFKIGLVFTVVSMVRQLVLRRWANRWKWSERRA
jgi:membrane protein CcdC involved in cytochrome C biogenesis